MAFLNSLNISGSALTAEKLRMSVISQNIANVSTTKTDEGGPYHRKLVVFKENKKSFTDIMNNISKNTVSVGKSVPSGVLVSEILEDNSDLKAVYNPGHPDADKDGYVMMPNVDTTDEMVDMISATRSYEANVTAFNAVKLMATKALDIGR